MPLDVFSRLRFPLVLNLFQHVPALLFIGKEFLISRLILTGDRYTSTFLQVVLGHAISGREANAVITGLSPVSGLLRGLLHYSLMVFWLTNKLKKYTSSIEKIGIV
jgi:hypothetical protein